MFCPAMISNLVKEVESLRNTCFCSESIEHVGKTCFCLVSSDVGCSWTLGGLLFALVYFVGLVAFVLCYVWWVFYVFCKNFG